jgi:hypothetical protein
MLALGVLWFTQLLGCWCVVVYSVAWLLVSVVSATLLVLVSVVSATLLVLVVVVVSSSGGGAVNERKLNLLNAS